MPSAVSVIFGHLPILHRLAQKNRIPSPTLKGAAKERFSPESSLWTSSLIALAGGKLLEGKFAE